MHDYLRAIGFSQLKKNKDVREILNLAIQRPTSEYVSSLDNGETLFGEKEIEFSDRFGLRIRGEYDEEGHFHDEYYFPHLKGSVRSFKEQVTLEKQPDKDAYSGICDQTGMGVSLIFHLSNMVDYLDYQEFHKGALVYAPVNLTGLCTSGRILLPLMKTTKNEKRRLDDRTNRENMIAAARNGDQDAIESLTLEDIDLYATISRRSKREDVLTIVESYFMPYGISCDLYSVMGEISNVEQVRNTFTGEEVYILTLECNDIIFDVGINKVDLYGEPTPGRRFKGNIWMQGHIEFLGI